MSFPVPLNAAAKNSRTLTAACKAFDLIAFYFSPQIRPKKPGFVLLKFSLLPCVCVCSINSISVCVCVCVFCVFFFFCVCVCVCFLGVFWSSGFISVVYNFVQLKSPKAETHCTRCKPIAEIPKIGTKSAVPPRNKDPRGTGGRVYKLRDRSSCAEAASMRAEAVCMCADAASMCAQSAPMRKSRFPISSGEFSISSRSSICAASLWAERASMRRSRTCPANFRFLPSFFPKLP